MDSALQVKICGMRDPGNIREVLALPIDYLGLIFYPGSSRFVSHLDPDVFEHSTVKKVGVFVDSTTNMIQDTIDIYGLDVIQLHGNESIETCAYWKARGVTVWKAFGLDPSFAFACLKDYIPFVDRFVFDTKSSMYGGTGIKFEWGLLNKYEGYTPYLLSGGIGLDNLSEALELSDDRMVGFDLNSKLESAPGLKDLNLVRNALKTIHHE